MPRKSVALIGPGRGPEVLVRESSRVSIRGLRGEEFASVVQKLNEQEDIVLPVTEDGIYDLVDCRFAYVHYEGKNRGFIACILMGD